MQENDVVLRRVLKDDIPSLEIIYWQCCQYHEKIDPSFKKVGNAPELFVDYIKEHMETDKSILLVAERDDVLVGYSLAIIMEKPPVYEEREYGEIDQLAVLEEHQRSGIGEALFKETVQRLKNKDIKRIEVNVAIQNEKSINFWRKMGCRIYMKRCFWRSRPSIRMMIHLPPDFVSLEV